MINELVKDMVEAGVHYGHQTKKWNPKMKPYLMKDKGGIYIIDLVKTVQCLDKASDFLAKLAGKNKKILFVGCKRQAQDAVREAAEATGQYYVNYRWLGGTLTNLTTIRNSVKRLKYLEDMYMLQSKGKPIVELNTLIKIKSNSYTDAEYGVVIECIGKNTVKYVSVNKDMLPAMSKWGGNYYTYHSKMNVWKCDIVGEFTPDNSAAYMHAINDYNRNMNLRKEFWKNHPVLSGLNIPYQYYDMRIDVMNGELPTRMWSGHRQIWHIFKGCIDEKLHLEHENQ